MRVLYRETKDQVDVHLSDARIIDLERIQYIGNELEKIFQRTKNKRLIVDFRSVSFMSSAMFNKLIHLHQYVEQNDLDLRLTNINENIRELFELMKLDRLFRLTNDDTGPEDPEGFGAGVPRPNPPGSLEGHQDHPDPGYLA